MIVQVDSLSEPSVGAPRPILGLKRDVRDELDDVALVALQHFLPSVVHLFKRLIAAGFRQDRIFLLGKPYSTVPTTARALADTGCYVHLPSERSFTIQRRYVDNFRALVVDYWKAVEQRLPPAVTRLVILDEGGWLYRDLPDSLDSRLAVTGVEHTMYGLINAPEGERRQPFVLMAASAAKTRFESPVIADAIVERLRESIDHLTDLQVGVIGLGNIGQAVVKALSQSQVSRILGYDCIRERNEDIEGLTPATRAQVISSDVLLGCTGTDSLAKGAPLHSLKDVRRCWLASCSSGDVEFLHIARQLANRVQALRADRFRDARGVIGNTEVTLLNGGFPLNFDRRAEREHPVRIQLTREITFAAVLQAALCLDPAADGGEVMLDAHIQQQLVEAWLECESARQLFPNWIAHSVEWWEKHSRGQSVATKELSDFVQVCS